MNIVIEQDSFLQGIVSDYKGVRRPWIGSDKDPLYKQYRYNTGIDIYCDKVYSYANGTIVAVGSNGRTKSVTVQYDVFSCLRYENLSEVSVSAGDIVQAGFYIGKAHSYLHFEYITKGKDSSLWPVRIGSETYYKQNPISLLGVIG